MGRGHDWVRQAKSARRVSLSLGLVLSLLCVLALATMVRLEHSTQAAQASSRSADLYQDARYFAAVESRELDGYRLEPDPSTLRDHNAAAAALNATLAQLRKTDSSLWLGNVLLDQDWYQSSARLFFILVDNGDLATADRLDADEIDPVSTRLEKTMGTLEEQSHIAGTASIAETVALGHDLRVGTPIAIGLGIVLLGLIVLANRAYRRTIEKQASEDALTGLPNRTVFSDRAVQALAQVSRAGTDPVVLLLDLDEFKEVNDTLGHLLGDNLLVQVARRLAGVVRAGDTVARLGGDEFAILLPDGGATAGKELAERIIHTLHKPFTLDEVTVGMEASIGIASYAYLPANSAVPVTRADIATRVKDLLRHADTAMYTAKSTRVGYALYCDDHEDATPQRLAVLGELRLAFERDELVVHFQPKIATDDDRVVGVEALVRWQHPVRGLLPPSEFIALAESTSLIHPLTSIVLDKALASARAWLDAGRETPVAVNISARSLGDPGFSAMVKDKLLTAGVPARLLCLEVTESAIMHDPEGAIRVLRDLHGNGVRLSIDDFGTGYSSMAHLKILPVDELKVDRSFIADMTTNERNTVLVQSAIDLGHNLGLAVVAEGVEDQLTMNALEQVGADVVQGYHLGRPMPGDELTAWMDDRASRPTTAADRI